MRKADFIYNRDPFRPGSIGEGLDDVVKAQYTHLGFGERSFKRFVTKYIVRGVRWRGAGIDDTDIVWMWCPQTKACVVIKAVRSER